LKRGDLMSYETKEASTETCAQGARSEAIVREQAAKIRQVCQEYRAVQKSYAGPKRREEAWRNVVRVLGTLGLSEEMAAIYVGRNS
jgi:hypothetical protein